MTGNVSEFKCAKDEVCYDKFIIGFSRCKPMIAIRGLTKNFYTKGDFVLGTILFFLYLLFLYDMWHTLDEWSCFKIF